MTTNVTNAESFTPTIADCEAHATYWRDVAADPRTNHAAKIVARSQELAWLTIALNLDGFMVEERGSHRHIER